MLGIGARRAERAARAEAASIARANAHRFTGLARCPICGRRPTRNVAAAVAHHAFLGLLMALPLGLLAVLLGLVATALASPGPGPLSMTPAFVFGAIAASSTVVVVARVKSRELLRTVDAGGEMAPDLARRLLGEGRPIRMVVDASHGRVVLPTSVRASGHVVLTYGPGLAPPIPDLRIDDEGISATLSFAGVRCATFVPWAAIRATSDVASADQPADAALRA